MMALIHRIETTLPHGRALLYDRIAEAYLESIDKFRGVYSSAYNLPQKRRWLARVGYEMQRRRSTDQAQANGSDESELLVESRDVLSWLREEMGYRGGTSEDISAEEFLDFVGRRSGLFLPRGEGRYAFVHLSFQEYFAAVALEREVTGIKWARNERTSLGLNRDNLRNWARQSAWGETFSFLFELLASKEEWHADLLDTVFGREFSRLEKNAPDNPAMNLARLLARLAINQRSGLARTRGDAITAAVRAEFQHGTVRAYPSRSPSVFEVLLRDDPDRKILELIGAQARKLNVRLLSLAETQVSDLGPLAQLRALKALDLSETRVSDLGPLAQLRMLERLDLWETQVSDLGPLAQLRALKALDLSETRVSDLGPLANLTALKSLDLDRTQVSDLKPLNQLTRLERLDLWETQVSDLGPLANLTALKSLDLDRTQVSDLRPLNQLTRLERLDLSQTQVSDLGPLANLTALETLSLWRTRVSDLGPLANLTALKSLDLDQTQVSDLGPLTQLTVLKTLDLQNTQVSERMVSELRDSLPKCNILF